jgi:transcriptional regulator with XRE-family HTH domain
VPELKRGFNGDAFYRALEHTVAARSTTWKQVSQETGVSASTLTRMAKGRRPDASSLAALSAWAGLNPSDFVKAAYKPSSGEPMAQISTLLRTDPNLDAGAAEAVEAIVRAAYERLRKPHDKSYINTSVANGGSQPREGADLPRRRQSLE